MKKRLWLTIAVTLCLSVAVAFAAAPAKPAVPAAKVPGTELAVAISTITGVAISPLLGVGAVGAWKYFHTPSAQKAGLPWYAQPLFWIPALLLVLVVMAKDLVGAAAPTALKKPLDVAETIENKVSGLVAAGAFVPLVAAVFHSDSGATAALGPLGFAMIGLSPVFNLLLLPFAVIAFVLVWIVAHTINVLILISPFTTVDTTLKGIRAALLSSVTLTAFANPLVGAIWALVIIVIAYFLAGWAFRLMVYGTVFVWDFTTFRRTRFQPEPKANWVFLAHAIDRTPIRTYGQLARNERGELAVQYRPWLFLQPRELVLPAGNYVIGRGLVNPEVLRTDGEKPETMLLFPPRYRSHEEALAKIHGFPMQDVGMLKGLKSVWRFIKEMCGFGQRVALNG